MRNIKLILVALSMLPASALALEAPFFPRLVAHNLEKQRVVLPRDFAGDVNVIVVSFKRRQAGDVETWTPWLHRIEAQKRNVRWYSLPTTSRTAGRIADWIVGRGSTEPDRRRRTIPLHVDKERFGYFLGLPDDAEEDIHILVVTRRAAILARVSGRFTPEKAAVIEQALIPRK